MFSNYGAAGVDVAAPGERILSTLPRWLRVRRRHVDGQPARRRRRGARAGGRTRPGRSAQVRDRILATVAPDREPRRARSRPAAWSTPRPRSAPTTNLAPVVTITKPATGTSVLRGVKVTFAATAVDPEQGNVASSISWVSSRMGKIGTGASFSRSDLVEGTHVIVAIAKDAAHHTPLASIVLRVGPDGADDRRRPGPARAGRSRSRPDGTPVVAWAEHGIGHGRQPRPGRRRLDAGGRLARRTGTERPTSASTADGTVHLAIERDWTRALGLPRQRDPRRDVRRRGGLDDGAGGGGLRRRRRRLRHGRLADLRRGLGRPRARRVGRVASSAGRRQRAGPVARHRARERHVDVRAGAGGVVGRRWRRTSRPARPTRSTSRSSARTPATRASTTRRTKAGSWVVTKVAALGAGAGVAEARVQVARLRQRRRRVGPARTGSFVATRTRRDVGLAGRGVAGSGGIVDLVRDGRRPAPRVRPAERRAARGRRVRRLASAGARGRSRRLDDGADATPRLAVDGAGHAHVAYLRTSPEPEVRYATNAAGGWATRSSTGRGPGVDPAFAVDAAGIHHVAVGRIGTEPGVWYGTDAGGALVDGAADDEGARRPRRAGGRAGRDRVDRLRGVGRAAGRPGSRRARRATGRWRSSPTAPATGTHADRAGRQRVAPRRVRRRPGRQDPTSPTPRTPAAAGS